MGSMLAWVNKECNEYKIRNTARHRNLVKRELLKEKSKPKKQNRARNSFLKNNKISRKGACRKEGSTQSKYYSTTKRLRESMGTD